MARSLIILFGFLALAAASRPCEAGPRNVGEPKNETIWDTIDDDIDGGDVVVDNRHNPEKDDVAITAPNENTNIWGPCSRTCGGGYQLLTKGRQQDAIRRPCNVFPCCDSNKWEECQCNGYMLNECGRQKRCTPKAEECKDEEHIQKPICTSNVWTKCTKDCGGGIQRNACGMARACNTQSCDVNDCDGSQWTPCSSPCGGGLQYKRCRSASPNKQACNAQACPSNSESLFSLQEGSTCSLINYAPPFSSSEEDTGSSVLDIFPREKCRRGLVCTPTSKSTGICSDPQDEVTVPENGGGAGCACAKIYKPVCGENGVTYGNECEANCAGVGYDTFGECTKLTKEIVDAEGTSGNPDSEKVEITIGANGKLVVNKKWCENVQCESPPPASSPAAAVHTYCGSDGKEYSLCGARCSGLTKFERGPCDAQKIAFEKAIVESCEQQCSSAPDMPVCGSDGKTYRTSCSALNCGRVSYVNGSCEDAEEAINDLSCAASCDNSTGAVCGIIFMKNYDSSCVANCDSVMYVDGACSSSTPSINSILIEGNHQFEDATNMVHDLFNVNEYLNSSLAMEKMNIKTQTQVDYYKEKEEANTALVGLVITLSILLAVAAVALVIRFKRTHERRRDDILLNGAAFGGLNAHPDSPVMSPTAEKSEKVVNPLYSSSSK